MNCPINWIAMLMAVVLTAILVKDWYSGSMSPKYF